MSPAIIQNKILNQRIPRMTSLVLEMMVTVRVVSLCDT